jgi:hypothetical protein
MRNSVKREWQPERKKEEADEETVLQKMRVCDSLENGCTMKKDSLGFGAWCDHSE